LSIDPPYFSESSSSESLSWLSSTESSSAVEFSVASDPLSESSFLFDPSCFDEPPRRYPNLQPYWSLLCRPTRYHRQSFRLGQRPPCYQNLYRSPTCHRSSKPPNHYVWQSSYCHLLCQSPHHHRHRRHRSLRPYHRRNPRSSLKFFFLQLFFLVVRIIIIRQAFVVD
jgi:hypothetical protein